MKEKIINQLTKTKNWVYKNSRQILCFTGIFLFLKTLFTTKNLTAAVLEFFLNIATIFLAAGISCVVLSVFRLILSFAEYEEPDNRKRLKLVLYLFRSGICIVIGLAIKVVMGSRLFSDLLRGCLPLGFIAAGSVLFIRLIQTLMKEDLSSLERISKEKKTEWLKAVLPGILCFAAAIMLILI